MKFVLLLVLISLKSLVEASCPASVTAEANGYSEVNGKWYKKSTVDKTFAAAAAECEVHGARLAMFKTDQEFTDVKAMVMSGTSHTWIGALNRKMEVMCMDGSAWGDCTNDQFHWIDGSPLSNVAAYDVIFDTNENAPCMLMTSNGLHVGDYYCFNPLPFICQLDCNDVVSNTPECNNIPTGYEKLFDGAYYKATSNQNHLVGAIADCHADGAKLAKVESDEALQSIKYILHNHDWATTNGLRTAYVNPTGTNCANFPGASHTECNNLYMDIDDAAPFVSQSWMGSSLSSWGVETLTTQHCSRLKFYNANVNMPTAVSSASCGEGLHSICRFKCDETVGLPSVCTNDEPYLEIMGRHLLYQAADTFDNAVKTCIAKRGKMLDFKDPSQLGLARILADVVRPAHGMWIGLKNTDNIFTCLNAAACSAPEIVWVNDNSQFDLTVSTHLTEMRFNTAAFQYGYMTEATWNSPLPVQGASASEAKEFFCEITCVTCSAPTAPTTGQSYDWDVTRTSAYAGESTT